MLLDRDVEVSVPMKVPKHFPGAHKLSLDELWDRSYRPSGYPIMAACSGSIEILRLFPFDDLWSKSIAGFICFSKKRKNLVNSNVIGGTAYHGHSEMLEHLLIDCDKITKKLNKNGIKFVELKSTESPDTCFGKNEP